MTAYLQSEALGGLHTLLGTLTLARGFMAKSSHKKKENILGRKGYPGFNGGEYPNRRKNVEERKLDKLMLYPIYVAGAFRTVQSPDIAMKQCVRLSSLAQARQQTVSLLLPASPSALHDLFFVLFFPTGC